MLVRRVGLRISLLSELVCIAQQKNLIIAKELDPEHTEADVADAGGA